MENLMLNRIEKYSEKINQLFDKINEFEHIAIFRHDHPDSDALGSQLGLVEFIKENFKGKDIVYVGDDHITLTGNCFPKMQDISDDWFKQDFLAIILDLSNLDRVADERCKLAKYKIKIDHHPEVEHYGNLEIVDESMIACGELLAAIMFSNSKFKVTKVTAENLYKAIVSDSGRFMYAETSELTFLIAQKLVATGINLNKIYNDLYDNNLNDLEVKKYILENFKVTEHGVAYYILTDKDLKRFNLEPIQGKDNINTFAHYKGINVWLSVTEDVKKGHWRVSIRSAGTPIDKVAENYIGGGHPQASGAKLKSLDELPNLLNDLDNLFQ